MDPIMSLSCSFSSQYTASSLLLSEAIFCPYYPFWFSFTTLSVSIGPNLFVGH